MVGAIEMALGEKADDLEVRDKKSQLLIAAVIGGINTLCSVLIVFSTAPLALSVQAAS